jgi:2Fe-2S ferredoxin
MYTVNVKFEQKGLEPVTLSNIEPDQSLLEVCLDNGIELHHNYLTEKKILLTGL